MQDWPVHLVLQVSSKCARSLPCPTDERPLRGVVGVGIYFDLHCDLARGVVRGSRGERKAQGHGDTGKRGKGGRKKKKGKKGKRGKGGKEEGEREKGEKGKGAAIWL